MSAADSVGTFDLRALEHGEYELVVSLSPEAPWFAVPEAHLPQDVFLIDRASDEQPPAFARVFELPSGRHAGVDSLWLDTHVVNRPPEFPESWADEDPINLQLARMGKRAFLRVEIRPFRAGSEADVCEVVTTMRAIVRVSSESEPASRARMARQPMVAPLSSGSPDCLACPPSMPVGVPEGIGDPEHFAPRRSVTNQVAWKIRISEPGLYRITGEDLAQAGVPAAYRDSTLLQLAARDQTIPMWASVSGALSATDWLMFYGAASESASTTQNVYWLSVGEEGAEPLPLDAAPSYADDPITTAWTRIEYAPKTLYRAAYNPLNAAYDHWFAMEVYGGTTSNIPFATPAPVLTGQVHVAYSLHGLNATPSAVPDHRSVIRVGAQVADTREYDGEVQMIGTSSVPASALSPGTTLISVEQQIPTDVPNAAFSSAYIEWLRLCYQRALVADPLPLFFSGPSDPGTIRVTQIPTNTVWLLDVSNPFQPRQLDGYTLAHTGGAWRIDFEDDEGGSRCFALFGEQSIQSVAAIELVRFRNLVDVSRQADYLIVTPSDFREPVFRLLRHRQKNGLQVQVATPEDVYNEFSYGMPDPVGLRQYFGYAYHHYESPEPQYVLLVGFGSFDPRKHLGSTVPEHIPTYIGPAPWRRTAWEQWFVTVDGTLNSQSDLLPDMRIGRIPAVTVSEVSNAVHKIISFETAPTNAAWRKTAMLVADKVDASNNFKSHVQTNTLAHLVAGGFDSVFDIQTAFRDDLTQSQSRTAIQGAFQGGTHLVHYMGHGGVLQWASPNIWHVNDVTNTSNSVYPIVAVFTCQNGFFYDPAEKSMSEALILGAHGAAALIAPSALSVQIYANRLADGYYEALAVDRADRLGDALQEGFLRLWTYNPNIAELRFYTIFGDPALQVWGGAHP